MAVSVAAGVPCLGRFPVATRGPVLLFAAENAPHIVRARLQGICASAGVPWDSLDIHVIVDPVVRLDVPTDRARLLAEVERLRPRLVVLDPFVRMHRIDESTASEVAPLLAYLRELQRRLGCAVALVHHARKGGHARAGQALRGSSELHAWGDSNLYLRRDNERLLLSIEHRAAASSTGLELELADRGGGLTLHVREAIDAPTQDLREQQLRERRANAEAEGREQAEHDAETLGSDRHAQVHPEVGLSTLLLGLHEDASGLDTQGARTRLGRVLDVLDPSRKRPLYPHRA